ncbi:MAG: DUF948 domain-containing protein [Propionibacteriaceae bacterium]|jgi:uncharacterized protein YoxC|nr:DUF948 domain-containing protein [Propionibacteriaceae bacterium]
MTVTLGGIAGLIAAIALLGLVVVVALPLYKLSRVMDELTSSVKELTDSTVPILTELEQTVSSTNDEMVKIGVVTDDIATVSGKASDIATDTARVSKLIADTVAVPFLKIAALSASARRAFAGLRKRHERAAVDDSADI